MPNMEAMVYHGQFCAPLPKVNVALKMTNMLHVEAQTSHQTKILMFLLSVFTTFGNWYMKNVCKKKFATRHKMKFFVL